MTDPEKYPKKIIRNWAIGADMNFIVDGIIEFSANRLQLTFFMLDKIRRLGYWHRVRYRECTRSLNYMFSIGIRKRGE